jgi:hypothetical protein
MRTGAPGLAALLAVHPMFWPRTYVQPVIEVDGDRVRFALRADSPIFGVSLGKISTGAAFVLEPRRPVRV